MTRHFTIGISIVTVIALVMSGMVVSQLSAIGAGALLVPTRHVSARQTPDDCAERKFAGDGVVLAGWVCRTSAANRKGTIVYLHGVADNRGSSVGAIGALVPLGFDVIAYDSRGHGASEGDRCTYGYYEKRDLRSVLDQLAVDDVILIGHSLGAAVALQTAAVEPRVRGVVAASTFSDLRTIASERAFGLPAWSLSPAFVRAERDGQFVVDQVSPVRAATAITVPVLLIHGENDRDTLPIHSARVFDALRGSKKLITVTHAGHNDVLRAEVWKQIENWLVSI
jgi:pimeloyl-ACP methyl ester carboxylesterase